MPINISTPSLESSLSTSAKLATLLSDETGSGLSVFNNTPTLITPVLGVATATSINGSTIPTSKTLTVTTDKLSVFAATTSAELRGVLSDETGTGLSVFNDTPTLITPVLGAATGTSVVLTAQAQAATLIGTTSTTSPLLIGGSANGQALTIKPTIGTGTSGSDIIFQVGNNGGTEVFRFLSTGQQKLVGGLRYNRNAQSTSYQILITDYYVAFTGGASQTLTMPAPSVVGESYLIKNSGSAAVTLAGNGANIFGASTYSMSTAETVRLTYSGTIWETNN